MAHGGGSAICGEARHGMAWLGPAGRGAARQGKARVPMARFIYLMSNALKGGQNEDSETVGRRSRHCGSG